METFANLPTPLKAGIGGTGLAALGVGGYFAYTGGALLVFVLILLGLLLLLVGGFLLWNRWQRKQQSARLRSDLSQSVTAAPRGMSATDLAKLDNLRKKFEEGVEAFRSRGKNLYTLPWYVIIGEPGSGKTEAIRHCNVGFPPGMHEGDNDTGYMGAGGTINMNWWFTNYAVLLDTAGRLVFEDVKPGETSEWREFLKLLKKNRPNCPINGLLLVIPSDSLIRDSADQLAAKAGKIAQQLDIIQRVLDFRFPVYVVISKSDKINGFREFFDGMTDPQLQHQMLGWANPEPLDAPFRAEVVDQHLTQVSERLGRRRLGLLRDPVPGNGPRRADEVDALFALPHSLAMLAPRLRSYLEKIFLPGEWSAKPLFLRGIYFTSAMREGAALDQELAEAIGISADELPEGKVWERDRAYFLKDLFLEKVFRERGLVTRATNTRELLRRRQMLMYGCTFAALAVFITVACFGMRAVRSRVADRAAYWMAAAGKDQRRQPVWARPIVKVQDDGSYALDHDPYYVAGRKLTLGQFQQQLRALAENEINGSWFSPGLAATYNDQSKRAQRAAFELGVLKPLHDAVSVVLHNPTSNSIPLQAEVVAEQIRLESDILSRAQRKPVELDARGAGSLLSLWSTFVSGQDAGADNDLALTMAWTYNSNRFGQEAWPPAWLSATVTTNKVTTNPLLLAGLESCVRTATNTVTELSPKWAQVLELLAKLKALEGAEGRLVEAVRGADRQGADAALAELKQRHAQADAALAQAAQNPLFQSGLTLGAARRAYTNQILTRASGALDIIKRADTAALRQHFGDPVFEAIANRLRVLERDVSDKLLASLQGQDDQEFARYDAQCLAGSAASKPYQVRCGLYEQAAALCSQLDGAGSAPGDCAANLNHSVASRNALYSEARAYRGYGSNDLAAVARYYLGPRFAEAYSHQANQGLTQLLGFPMFRQSTHMMTPAAVTTGASALHSIAADVQGLQGPELTNNTTWKAFAGRIAALNQVAALLKDVDGKPRLCVVSLRKPDPRNASDKWSEGLRKVRVQIDGKLNGEKDVEYSEQGDFEELAKVPLPSGCLFQLLDYQLRDETSKSFGYPGQWGALALLFRNPAKPAKEGDLSSWVIQCPFPDGGANVLTLKLTFDQALPELASWPDH